MALMERVAALLRADLSDLMGRADDPEALLQQLMLDMENQLLQVKTQVAIALADQLLLERKAAAQAGVLADWQRRAEVAVGRSEDARARTALQRTLIHERQLEAFRAQVADQSAEAEALRASFHQLQARLAQTRIRCELLLAGQRRMRLVQQAYATQKNRSSASRPQTERGLAGPVEDARVEEMLAELKVKARLLRAG